MFISLLLFSFRTSLFHHLSYRSTFWGIARFIWWILARFIICGSFIRLNSFAWVSICSLWRQSITLRFSKRFGLKLIVKSRFVLSIICQSNFQIMIIVSMVPLTTKSLIFTFALLMTFFFDDHLRFHQMIWFDLPFKDYY
jgi:hypothetical protein